MECSKVLSSVVDPDLGNISDPYLSPYPEHYFEDTKSLHFINQVILTKTP